MLATTLVKLQKQGFSYFKGAMALRRPLLVVGALLTE